MATVQDGRPITNPILPGFNPDPSLLRVGEDYFIATSTFEWFPGVALYHSRDLVNWRPIGHTLTRKSQLDILGDPDSGGVWAPCLSHDGSKFYVVFTDVKNHKSAYKDTLNYVVTADNITGPWSEPSLLNASGFDPSLFHDGDGRSWLVNMLWDHRPGCDPFGGIVIQEFCRRSHQLRGEPRLIFRGSGLGYTEGPHLYRVQGRYYLMLAEGGTGWNHAVVVARSDHLFGPYEVDPGGPMLTSAALPELELQKAGHGSLAQTLSGEWILAHLCARPVGPERRCILGRETALQRCLWTEDGWLRLAEGTAPAVTVPIVGVDATEPDPPPVRDDFDAATLRPEYQSLRVPFDESWISLTRKPGHLSLVGRQSPASLHHQALLGRRLTSFRAVAETSVDFEPTSLQQLAGLLCYYDTKNHIYAAVTSEPELGRVLTLLVMDRGTLSTALREPIKLKHGPVLLRASFETSKLQFKYRFAEGEWQTLGPELDATKLSDEYAQGGFTGTFIALGAHDMTGRGAVAHFDYFDYSPE